MEPNLNELKEQVIKECTCENCKCQEEEVEEREKAVVKIFKSNNQQDLEDKINEYIQQKDPWYLESINYTYSKIYLPMTTAGEYEEVWTAMVTFNG